MENLVSIIMNCYNGEKYLERSLKSVIAQNFKNWELIFWDNYSTDNSKEIFQSFSNPKFYDFSFSNSHIFLEKSNKKIPHTLKKLPSGLIYNFLAKEYLVTISSLIIKKKLLNEIGLFNSNYNIIGDFDFVMKISKTKQAHSIQDPLLQIRIHGDNFHDKNRKMFYKEFKNWFQNQENDLFFIKNKKFFLKKLFYLFFVSLFPTFIKDFIKKK